MNNWDPEPGTAAELEVEQARAEYYAAVDRTDPDNPGMANLDDDEARLAEHDAVMGGWA